jgi:Rps23 Pro-64 3,4-dihydroxylase Tpa1-like proline 4-hydroxylase
MSQFRNLSNNDLKKIKKIFKEDNCVIIDDFFSLDFANSIYDWYNNKMPKEWWHLSVSPNSGIKNIINIDENKDLMEKEWENSGKAIVDSTKMSHRFYRTVACEHDTCTCESCKNIYPIFESKEMTHRIKDITNFTFNDVYCYTSKFTAGSFLGIHNDKGNGDYGFVYNFTKKWSSQYGGQLSFLDDNNEVTDVIYPKFNSFVLFKIPEEGIPHFVSYVPDTLNSSINRLSINGWFSFVEELPSEEKT